MNGLKSKNWLTTLTCLTIGIGFLANIAFALQDEVKVSQATLKNLQWRCIGPAIMGGRIDAFAVVERKAWIIYAATASGGLWKTTNNGVTWEPIFDGESTSSIGAVAVAPSDPSIVWVGTGEPNNRQSSSWGDGIYKSTDGGKTWINMGLKDSHHIGRIIIHPTNANIIYVAALGHLWGSNKERCLFKTSDGGKTWVNTLYINDDTGCVDAAMDPDSPDTLYAAAYQRRRTAWGFNGGGPHSGLYKTTDGGKNWTRLTNGLPPGDTGRIGINIYRKNPKVVYALVENKNGGIFRSEDKGVTWEKMNSLNPRPMYYSKIRVDPNNDQRVWVLGVRSYFSQDGGKTFQPDIIDIYTSVHNDHHAMWINPANSKHLILGGDGGIYFSYDQGKNWDFVNTLPLGQVYEIGADMRRPYYIYAGLQDNGIWGGPSATMNLVGITNDDWFKIRRGDGFYAQIDPTDYTTIYTESTNGNLFRYNLRTGERRAIKPEPKEGEKPYRFNWNSPLLISPHNPNTIYFGGNRLFKSTDQGETWSIGPDLTTQTDRDKLPIMGVLVDENTLSRHDGVAFYGTITAIAESPLREGLLFVGTDDGNLLISLNGGRTWKNVANNLPGLPKGTYVSRVVASHFKEERAYATFDGHRNGDFIPYVYFTNNHGESWKLLSNKLPVGSTVNVIREHPRNPDLLFIGSERGAYVSFDRGVTWVLLKGTLPIVPVDDILIHPRDNDLILGTHGRSIWVLDDITPLEQLTSKVLSSNAYLFDVRAAAMFNYNDHKFYRGNKIFVAPNPPFGGIISYYLSSESKDKVKVIIADKAGKVIRELDAPKDAGINRIAWDLRYPPPPKSDEVNVNRYRPPLSGAFVLPGEYVVKLCIGEEELAKTIRVEGDPRIELSDFERRALQETVLTLSGLYNSAVKASKVSKDIKAQLCSLKENIKKQPQVPKEVISSIDSKAIQVDEFRGQLVRSPQLRRRGIRSLLSRIDELYYVVNRYNGAPTPSQVEQVEVISKRLNYLIEQLNLFIEKSIPELNNMLKENNIPPLHTMKPVKHP